VKKYRSIIYILAAACACLFLIGCETSQAGGGTAPAPMAGPPKSGGRLIIYRVANFGTDLSLVLTVDGKDVASLTEGQSYNGYLSPGQHTLSARIDPNPGGVDPWQKSLTVQAGQTYSYTGSWSGGKLKLIPNR
jgi:hypothetical protein